MKLEKDKSGNDADLSVAIAPNIFDAYLNPDLLLPLVLGNLLSSRLWSLSDRISQKLSQAQSKPDPCVSQHNVGIDPMDYIRAIQREIDRNFTHLQQSQVAEIYGELDLAQESARLGQDHITRAAQALTYFYTNSPLVTSWPEEIKHTTLSDLEQQRFPAFYYANFDVIRAHRFMKGSRANAPMGLTSCLDEVSIFAALAMTLKPGIVQNVIVLSCLTHYTAFGWNKNGASWWLYGKNKFFTQTDWQESVQTNFNGDAQLAFNQRFQDFDKITSVAGTFDLNTGRSSISALHVDEIIQKLDLFFGCRLTQISSAISHSRKQEPESTIAPIMRELLGTQSIDLARTKLLRSDDEASKQALYSYRSLQIANLSPYLSIARHNPSAKRLGAKLESLQHAVDVVKEIEGSTSIFDDRTRIAMPDETLRLRTGSDIDKALLLHVLTEHYHRSMGLATPCVTLVTQIDSFVCSGDFCFNLNRMSSDSKPTEGIIMEFSDPMAP